MADTKISGLPASTTPLAGTEVLPIVQSGVTKQVSVANLTAGRDVSANIFSSAAGAVATPSITTTGDTNTGIWFPAADTIAASTAGTERMRIDSAGRVGIGLVAPSAVPGATLLLSKSITGGVVGVGVAVSATIASDVTVIGRGFSTEIGIQNATFTVPDLQHFIATQGTKGASATITNQYGFNASSTLTGATNNYGFYGNIASGTGRFNFYAGGTAANVFAGTTSIGGLVGAESLRVTPVASAVNFLDINGAIAAGKPFLYANGSDTNVSMNLVTKGTGSFVFLTNTGTATQFVVAQSGTTAVNYIQVQGDSASLPFFSSQGSSANIDMGFVSKGTGFHTFYTGGTSYLTQFRVAHTASAVNYLQVTGGATGTAATLSAQGSDTNIDLALTPKGTGVLAFGTYTAGIIAQAGSISIKDAAGNTRRLLVG